MCVWMKMSLFWKLRYQIYYVYLRWEKSPNFYGLAPQAEKVSKFPICTPIVCIFIYKLCMDSFVQLCCIYCKTLYNIKHNWNKRLSIFYFLKNTNMKLFFVGCFDVLLVFKHLVLILGTRAIWKVCFKFGFFWYLISKTVVVRSG